MNLCRLILVILIGLLISPVAFAGKDDREPQTTTAIKNTPTPADELLDALSTIFETEDHHEPRVLSYKPPGEGVSRSAKYGDKAPLNVAPIIRQKALARIMVALKEDPKLFYDVISKQDEYLVGHYCQHLDQSLKLWVLPLTRAVWAAFPDEEVKELMVQAYHNGIAFANTNDEEFRLDIIQNTPYRDFRLCNPIRIKGNGWK